MIASSRCAFSNDLLISNTTALMPTCRLLVACAHRYTGNDAVGISLSATLNADLIGRNVVRNIVSASGNAYGMQVMQVSDFIRGRLVVGSLQTLQGSQTYVWFLPPFSLFYAVVLLCCTDSALSLSDMSPLVKITS